MFYRQQSNPLYHTAVWQKVRAVVLIRDNYLCQRCLRSKRISVANTVHHIKPLEEYPKLALEITNLESLCAACHNKEHPEKHGQGSKQTEDKPERRARIIMG